MWQITKHTHGTAVGTTRCKARPGVKTLACVYLKQLQTLVCTHTRKSAGHCVSCLMSGVIVPHSVSAIRVVIHTKKKKTLQMQERSICRCISRAAGAGARQAVHSSVFLPIGLWQCCTASGLCGRRDRRAVHPCCRPIAIPHISFRTLRLISMSRREPRQYHLCK